MIENFVASLNADPWLAAAVTVAGIVSLAALLFAINRRSTEDGKKHPVFSNEDKGTDTTEVEGPAKDSYGDELDCVEFYLDGHPMPDLTLTGVTEVYSLDDTDSVMIQTEGDVSHRVSLGNNDVLLCTGEKAREPDCLWENVDRVRVWVHGKVIYDKYLAEVEEDLDNGCLTGYDEKGTDVSVLFGDGVTVLLDAAITEV